MKLFLNTFLLSLITNLCFGLSDSRLSQILMKTDNIENLTDLNKTSVVAGESDVNSTTEQLIQASTTAIETTSTTVLDTSSTGITSTESISTPTSTSTVETTQFTTSTTTQSTTSTTTQSTTSTTASTNTTANSTTTASSLADVIPTRYAQAAQSNLSDLAQNITDTLTSAFGEHTDRLFTIDSETANEKYSSKYTRCQVYSNGLLCRLFYPYIIKQLNQNVNSNVGQTTTRKPSGLTGVVISYNPDTGVFNNNNNGLSNTYDYSSLLASLFGQGYDNGYNNYPYNYAINNNNNNFNGISNNNNLFGYYSGYNTDNTNYYSNYNRRQHHKNLNRFGVDVY